MDEDVTPQQRLICRDIQVDIPYPPIKVEGPNIDYAVAMFKLYAGHDSELTATSQYLYQNMILITSDPTSADLLECISVDERAHFRILGQLIYLLGADPRYYSPTTLRGQTLRSQIDTGIQGAGSNGYSWWSGEVLLYTKDYTTMIQDNLQLEYITIANYNAVQREIGDIYVQAIIERILADEYRHIEIFTDMLKTAETPVT